MAFSVTDPFGFLRGPASNRGAIAPDTPTNVKLTAPSGTTYRVSGDFHAAIRSMNINFRVGETYVILSDTLAAVQAAAAARSITLTAV